MTGTVSENKFFFTHNKNKIYLFIYSILFLKENCYFAYSVSLSFLVFEVQSVREGRTDGCTDALNFLRARAPVCI